MIKAYVLFMLFCALYGLFIKSFLEDWERTNDGKYRIRLAYIYYLVVIAVVSPFVIYVVGIYFTTARMEYRLSVQHRSLSEYVSGFFEQSGGFDAQSDQLDRILSDALKGRYDNGGFSSNGAFFSAFVEYSMVSPEVLLRDWSILQDYITSQREGYRNVQDKLLDMLRDYDAYRTANPIRAFVLKVMGFPGGNIEVRSCETTTSEVARTRQEIQFRANVSKYIRIQDGNLEVRSCETTTGEAARNQMYGDAKAYETGTMAPLQVPTPTK